MLLLLTEDAFVQCTHKGTVDITATQSLVTVAGRRIQVQPDPEKRPIGGCPNTNPLIGIKPCTATLKVRKGYSSLLRIDKDPVCLQSVVGYTDGTPPGTVDYVVRNAGQNFVSEAQ